MFVALSLIAGLFEFVYFPAPFLKFDLSEVVVLFAIYVIGPGRAVVVVVLRSTIRWLITGGTNIPFPFFGELIAIYSSSFLILLFSLIIGKQKITKGATFFLLLFITTIAFSLTSLNLLLTFPSQISKGKCIVLNANFINTYYKANTLTYFNFVTGISLPFNLLKYSINVFVAWPVLVTFNRYRAFSKNKKDQHF